MQNGEMFQWRKAENLDIIQTWNRKQNYWIFKCCSEGRQKYEYIILILYRYQSASGKKKWLDKYLPGISSSHCLFVPYGKNKAEFVETMLHRKLGKMDILVDDHTPNLTRWETAGGTGVKWLNGINGKNGRFEGIRVGSVEKLKAAFNEIGDRK